MRTLNETVLATIPGSQDGERLLVVLCQPSGEESYVQLRQQSWGDGLGWFTQSSVELEPAQVADLRNALGGGAAQARRPSLPRNFSQISQSGSFPRVVRADSA